MLRRELHQETNGRCTAPAQGGSGANMKADGFPPNSYGIHTYYLAIRREREAHLTERAPAEYLQITAQDRPPVGLIEKLCLPAIANDRSRPVGARR
jgi:hypothetical protein